MHNPAPLTLKSSTLYNTTNHGHSSLLQNPPRFLLIHSTLSQKSSKKPQFPIINCNNTNGIELGSLLKHGSTSTANSSAGGSAAAVVKQFDVATLGNLCVDIILNVPDLPPSPREERKAYMDQLSKSPPDKVGTLGANFLDCVMNDGLAAETSFMMILVCLCLAVFIILL